MEKPNGVYKPNGVCKPDGLVRTNVDLGRAPAPAKAPAPKQPYSGLTRVLEELAESQKALVREMRELMRILISKEK